jgi:peptide/nickel transport system substrate-binding protein
VDKRLPENPLVITPLQEVGVYGGTWRMAWKGPADYHAYGRQNVEGVLAWPMDPKGTLELNLAEKYEFSNDNKDLTLTFRKGLKWSDGNPWTVDDIIFWWENIENNKDLTAAPHSEWISNGKPMTLEKISDNVIKLKFDAPNGLILRMLAFHGNQWPMNFERFGFYAPAHFLKQYHPKFNTAVTDYKAFNEKADYLNAGVPVMTPWMVTTYKPGDPKLIASRNPYYWKVDPKGQQYPYIDTLELTLVNNNDAVAALALSCEIDNQFRSMDLKKFPLFKENEAKCNTKTLRWTNAQGTALALWPNQSYTADPVLGQIFANKDFRIALSYAIDRKKINDVSYLSQGFVNSEMVVPDSPFFIQELATLYSEYDVKKAAESLDKAGLKMGPDGKVRLRPDGKPLEVTIETERTGADLDAVQLVAEFWTAVGVKTTVKAGTRDLFWPRATGNEVQISVWSTDRGLEPFVDPIYIFPFDERSWMAPAYGTYYKTAGKQGIKPTGKLAEAQALYDQMKLATDQAKFLDLGKQLIKLVTEEAWTIQTVGGVPAVEILKTNMRNVPEKVTVDWIFFSPGNQKPFTFYYKP